MIMPEKPSYGELEKQVQALKGAQAALKKAEAALRDSEEKYHKTFESITDSITVTRVTDGLYFYVNDGFCHQTGYSRQEVLGRTPSDINLYADPAEREQFIEILKRYGKAENVMVSFRRKNGEIYFSEFSAKPITYAGEDCLLAQSRDITERKRAEEALVESEEKYRLLVENQNDMVVKFDRDQKMEFVSPSYCKTFGIKQDDILGKSFFPFIREDDIETVKSSIFSLKKPPHISYHEERAKTVDGWRWFGWSLKAVLDDGGNIAGTFSVGRDITEQKVAEKALRETQRQLATLMSNLPGMAYRCRNDPDWTFVFASDGCLSLTGYNSADLVGNAKIACGSLIHEDDRQMVWDTIQIALKNKRPFNLTYRITTADQRELWVWEQGQGIFDVDNNIIALEGFITDISEQKQLEAKLLQAQKMESIGTLAGGIAHDFNNILGIILGNTELAMDDVPEWNPASRNLDEARKACLRAKGLVKQILSFSRKSETERKPLRISSVVSESLKFLRASIPTSIEILQNIANDVHDIMGDPTQIHQIMINLCTNSAHAMEDEGGTLEVAMENIMIHEDAASRYPELNPGPHVHLRVKDTGDGISPEVIGRVFDPYFTTKDVGKGTGLGLSVVHGIVNSHHGRISVESKAGKGTTFSILLPAVEGRTKNDPEGFQKLPTGKEIILFIDDEAPMVTLNQQRLERLGYKVMGKTDPSEALAFFRANPDQIDLVITDMTMPHMTGDKLVREIAEIRPDMPIILCTGYSDKISKASAQELGVRKYIEKPIEKGTLARSVRAVLDGR